MSFIEQLSAIAFLIDFLFGVLFGLVGAASFASRREDRDYSLLHAPPDLISDGARVIHGVYRRGSGWVTDARRAAVPGEDAGNGNDDPGAHGQEPQR